MKQLSFESTYKKFYFYTIDEENAAKFNQKIYDEYIKILLLPAGYNLRIDFKQYTTTKASLFFVNIGQRIHIDKAGVENGMFICYNRDFYCVQIHDSEVACDGLLFNNIYNIPITELSSKDEPLIGALFNHIIQELNANAYCSEEMIRTYLKQIIIHATRRWKEAHLEEINYKPDNGIVFFRNFSRLVELHFREKHNVADYADLLCIAPKTLSKKFKQLNLKNPNDVIKNRIFLEAKRLLAYTNLSIKEISYQLGYDDPAYFNRIFAKKMGYTPISFRKDFVKDELQENP